jgi:hypothetical protein
VSKPLAAGSEKNAKIEVKPTANGFSVDVAYSRYQFVPEADALLVACRSIVSTRVAEEAASQHREVEPIEEQAIRVSTGRNIINARTSCRAYVEAVWKK